MTLPFDSVILVGFGGPTAMEEVRPFLANVLRGRPAPPERIEEVVRHYEIIGGRSPYNELTSRQAEALEERLREQSLPIPVRAGMRNWHPYLRDVLEEMGRAGLRRSVGFILAAQQNDASWDRYQRDVAEARTAVGAGAPQVDFVPPWHDHPLFIAAMVDRVAEALERVEPESREGARLVFTAHSIPESMAADAPYVAQLEEQAARIGGRFPSLCWRLAYQSRSGNPRDPWLGPDICDVVYEEAERGTLDLIVAPLGFLCDHVEVLYDLDVEAKGIADMAGMRLTRAQTVNDHPAFVRMMADVVRRHVARG